MAGPATIDRYLETCKIDRKLAWAMLCTIPADDRDLWISIGMALNSEFGDAGYSLFNDWSKIANNYDVNAVRAVWRSFKGGAVTIGTLIHIAKEHGWRTQYTENVLPAPEVAPPPKALKSDTLAYALQIWLASNYDDSYLAKHKYAIDKGIDWAAGASRGIAAGSLIGGKADCIIVPIRSIDMDFPGFSRRLLASKNSLLQI